ncbi:hypothetical protein N3K66_003901 [Trichothecium roseum]|uniref:Uncharacterized protein n=1 Tax=Trichothecium roseum TaxID=47278 RepID=A0ACC0V8A5_9HYPO|nr:hypothetical protein N3K66_003901 [Trichothecium roseum]
MEQSQAVPDRQRTASPATTQQHHPQPRPYAHIPPSASLPLRTAQSTPISSPGLFSPIASRPNLVPQKSMSESTSPAPESMAPYLHPLQTHRVRETHKALIDSDMTTGRKLINQYEVIEEIGRGMHGKVKLARNLETGDNVAIKIIPRFSKTRRLGKVTAMSPQDKTKKEIAILKKIRHPNVVALLEVIDDPELKKIYMVLEHAELGEIIWRKKGLPHICAYERRRIEREMMGEPPSAEDEKYEQLLERRQALKEIKRAKMAQNYGNRNEYWSLEYGVSDEPSSYGHSSRIPSMADFAISDGTHSQPGSRQPSRGPSRSQSVASVNQVPELDEGVDWSEDMETPGPLRSNHNSATALDGTMFGPYVDEGAFRGRSPSMADSIISHMSSLDFIHQNHDPFSEDFSFVPCFTVDQARSTFRDTVLGLEYLHYQGVVHRDIKPANLLWSRDHRVKISDFGVSYFGRPIREGEIDETVSESEARDFDDDLELAKTVGTPAFFAPELCYTDVGKEPPKISEQIDVWSLGVTLYCLIFARIPFLAEDEWQMFRKIANEEVYIPRRRLKPVDPSTSPTIPSLYKRQNLHPYRDDNDLEFEAIDDDLHDLLRKMLTKNPEHRIRLRDLKRHAWILQNMNNPIGWLDDTDPNRVNGRKIQVDEKEMSAAVVPLSFLERARSAVRKAVGKVMNPLVDRSESRSRRRATSSVASSAGDSMFNAPPSTYTRADRRRSLHPDDYFANAMRHADSSAETSVAYDPMATVLPPIDGMDDQTSGSKTPGTAQEALASYRQAHGVQTTPTTPSTLEGRYKHDFDFGLESRRARDIITSEEDNGRSRSVDRGIFGFADKRASPLVSVQTTNAPGNLQAPRHPRPMRSVDLGRTKRYSVASPLASYFQSGNLPPIPPEGLDFRQHMAALDRPRTAPRPDDAVPETQPLPSRSRNMVNAEPFARTKETRGTSKPAKTPCPPSSDDENWPQMPNRPHRGHTMTTAQSSSTDSIDALGTPLTSPSEVTSPVSAQRAHKDSVNRVLAFQSDPSLPGLSSSASSVSAALEVEHLSRAAVMSARPSLLETTDSLTPPALAKEPTDGFPLHNVFGNPTAMENETWDMRLQSRTPEVRTTPAYDSDNAGEEDKDDGSDGSDGSDDGILLMAKSKKRSSRLPPFEARRRDTNMSSTSVETAKQVPATSEEQPAQ